ncbi:unnamed protein product [Amoebophrya sp. A25]|nr:unnamed protein product [Amoebophrya sp. A25]|eukprot:GSA25T00016748001.1
MRGNRVGSLDEAHAQHRSTTDQQGKTCGGASSSATFKAHSASGVAGAVVRGSPLVSPTASCCFSFSQVMFQRDSRTNILRPAPLLQQAPRLAVRSPFPAQSPLSGLSPLGTPGVQLYANQRQQVAPNQQAGQLLEGHHAVVGGGGAHIRSHSAAAGAHLEAAVPMGVSPTTGASTSIPTNIVPMRKDTSQTYLSCRSQNSSKSQSSSSKSTQYLSAQTSPTDPVMHQQRINMGQHVGNGIMSSSSSSSVIERDTTSGAPLVKSTRPTRAVSRAPLPPKSGGVTQAGSSTTTTTSSTTGGTTGGGPSSVVPGYSPATSTTSASPHEGVYPPMHQEEMLPQPRDQRPMRRGVPPSGTSHSNSVSQSVSQQHSAAYRGEVSTASSSGGKRPPVARSARGNSASNVGASSVSETRNSTSSARTPQSQQASPATLFGSNIAARGGGVLPSPTGGGLSQMRLQNHTTTITPTQMHSINTSSVASRGSTTTTSKAVEVSCADNSTQVEQPQGADNITRRPRRVLSHSTVRAASSNKASPASAFAVAFPTRSVSSSRVAATKSRPSSMASSPAAVLAPNVPPASSSVASLLSGGGKTLADRVSAGRAVSRSGDVSAPGSTTSTQNPRLPSTIPSPASTEVPLPEELRSRTPIERGDGRLSRGVSKELPGHALKIHGFSGTRDEVQDHKVETSSKLEDDDHAANNRASTGSGSRTPSMNIKPLTPRDLSSNSASEVIPNNSKRILTGEQSSDRGQSSLSGRLEVPLPGEQSSSCRGSAEATPRAPGVSVVVTPRDGGGSSSVVTPRGGGSAVVTPRGIENLRLSDFDRIAEAEDAAEASPSKKELRKEISRLRYQVRDGIRVRDQWKKQHQTAQQKMRTLETQLMELQEMQEKEENTKQGKDDEKDNAEHTESVRTSSSGDVINVEIFSLADGIASAALAEATTSLADGSSTSPVAVVDAAPGTSGATGAGAAATEATAEQNQGDTLLLASAADVPETGATGPSTSRDVETKDPKASPGKDALKVALREKEEEIAELQASSEREQLELRNVVEKLQKEVEGLHRSGANMTDDTPRSCAHIGQSTSSNMLIADVDAGEGSDIGGDAADALGSSEMEQTSGTKGSAQQQPPMGTNAKGPPVNAKGAPIPPNKGAPIVKGPKGPKGPHPVPNAIPAKGKGKGGQGKGKGEVKTNGLVNLYWKPAMRDMRNTHAERENAADEPEADCPTTLLEKDKFFKAFLRYNAEAVVERDGVPVKLDFLEHQEEEVEEQTTSMTRKRRTIYSLDAQQPVETLPEEMLTEYFQKKRATVDFGHLGLLAGGGNGGAPGGLPNSLQANGGRLPGGSSGQPSILLDEKRIRMLEILLQRQKMTTQLTGRESILAIKNAFLSCDYDLVPLDSLVIVRNVHIVHVDLGEPVRKFVEEEGDAKLLSLDFPYCHMLVWEVCCKIPALEQRLECMMFASNFLQFYDAAMQRLNVAYNALLTIYRKRTFCASFFQTAKKLGNQLNRGSSVLTCEDRGFELSALEKLAQTKSSAEPRATLYHFILSLMNVTQESQMFSPQDIRRLEMAKTLRAFGVYDQCETLVASLGEVEKVVETGEYKNRETGVSVTVDRRRLTMVPSEFDRNDQFSEVMHSFVAESKEKAQQIATYACNVFGTYKELGVFFDDTASLWPPPPENGGRKDLFQIIFDFAEHCARAYADLETPALRPLREKIASRLGFDTREQVANGGDDNSDVAEESFLSSTEAEFQSDGASARRKSELGDTDDLGRIKRKSVTVLLTGEEVGGAERRNSGTNQVLPSGAEQTAKQNNGVHRSSSTNLIRRPSTSLAAVGEVEDGNHKSCPRNVLSRRGSGPREGDKNPEQNPEQQGGSGSSRSACRSVTPASTRTGQRREERVKERQESRQRARQQRDSDGDSPDVATSYNVHVAGSTTSVSNPSSFFGDDHEGPSSSAAAQEDNKNEAGAGDDAMSKRTPQSQLLSKDEVDDEGRAATSCSTANSTRRGLTRDNLQGNKETNPCTTTSPGQETLASPVEEVISAISSRPGGSARSNLQPMQTRGPPKRTVTPRGGGDEVDSRRTATPREPSSTSEVGSTTTRTNTREQHSTSARTSTTRTPRDGDQQQQRGSAVTAAGTTKERVSGRPSRNPFTRTSSSNPYVSGGGDPSASASARPPTGSTGGPPRRKPVMQHINRSIKNDISAFHHYMQATSPMGSNNGSSITISGVSRNSGRSHHDLHSSRNRGHHLHGLGHMSAVSPRTAAEGSYDEVTSSRVSGTSSRVSGTRTSTTGHDYSSSSSRNMPHSSNSTNPHISTSSSSTNAHHGSSSSRLNKMPPGRPPVGPSGQGAEHQNSSSAMPSSSRGMMRSINSTSGMSSSGMRSGAGGQQKTGSNLRALSRKSLRGYCDKYEREVLGQLFETVPEDSEAMLSDGDGFSDDGMSDVSFVSQLRAQRRRISSGGHHSSFTFGAGARTPVSTTGGSSSFHGAAMSEVGYMSGAGDPRPEDGQNYSQGSRLREQGQQVVDLQQGMTPPRPNGYSGGGAPGGGYKKSYSTAGATSSNHGSQLVDPSRNSMMKMNQMNNAMSSSQQQLHGPARGGGPSPITLRAGQRGGGDGRAPARVGTRPRQRPLPPVGE